MNSSIQVLLWTGLIVIERASTNEQFRSGLAWTGLIAFEVQVLMNSSVQVLPKPTYEGASGNWLTLKKVYGERFQALFGQFFFLFLIIDFICFMTGKRAHQEISKWWGIYVAGEAYPFFWPISSPF